MKDRYSFEGYWQKTNFFYHKVLRVYLFYEKNKSEWLKKVFEDVFKYLQQNHVTKNEDETKLIQLKDVLKELGGEVY